jgi:hypothetical protein
MGLVVSSLDNKNNLILCLNSICVAIALLLLPSSVHAQERQGLLLNAGLSVISDSNITRTVEKTPDKAAIFSPQLQFLNSIGQHNFIFGYQGDFVVYDDNSQFNYNEHELKLRAMFDHSYQINSEFTLGYQEKVEDPGSNNAQTESINNFNQLTRKFAEVKFYYGTKASSGQFVVGLVHNQQRYTNNQQSFRSLDRNQFTGTFFYRLAPKTRLLLEASVAANDNIVATEFTDQSSDANIYLAGVEWEATAATSGTFKLGYQSTIFDNAQLNDLTGLSYLLDISWQPSTYSRFTIGASRLTNESAQQDIGGAINAGYSLALKQDFTPLTSLNVKYEQDKSDFNSAQNRTDKRKRFEVRFAHSLRAWLDISLNFRHWTRSSNEALFNFSSNAVELSFTSKSE